MVINLQLWPIADGRGKSASFKTTAGGAEPMGRGDTITYKTDPEKTEPMRLGELQTAMIPPRTRDGKPTRQGAG